MLGFVTHMGTGRCFQLTGICAIIPGICTCRQREPMDRAGSQLWSVAALVSSRGFRRESSLYGPISKAFEQIAAYANMAPRARVSPIRRWRRRSLLLRDADAETGARDLGALRGHAYEGDDCRQHHKAGERVEPVVEAPGAGLDPADDKRA
jgi:hypothetical protein